MNEETSCKLRRGGVLCALPSDAPTYEKLHTEKQSFE